MAPIPSTIHSHVGLDRRALERRWERTSRLTREFLTNPLTLIGLILVGVIVVLAIFAPYISPARPGPDPYQMPRDWANQLAPPLTPGAPLGTSSTGGNIFYGVIWGARLSIGISFGVVTVTTLFGVFMGSVAGFYGGRIDELIMRLVDSLIAIPATIWAIAFVMAIGPSYFNIGVALCTMLWGTYARIIRGEIIHVKNEEFVDAARVTGVSSIGVLFKEVLPNSIQPIFVQSTLYMGRVVLIAAGLAFIGLAENGLAEWGRLTAQGQNDLIRGAWWTSFFPGMAIFVWAFGWNMIGDGLRDVLDPRLRTE